MEIQIYNPTQGQPLPPVQWNNEEVKAWIEDGLVRYKGVVYDETQIATAKKDRATLNKLVQAIDAKRKEMKALYLQPYEEFEAQVKELAEMIKKVSREIDAQVKAYENYCKEQKLALIKSEIYAPIIGTLAELIPYEQLHNPKWLNVTTSMAAIGEEMARKVGKITDGLSAIDSLKLTPDVEKTIKGVFLRDFDLAAALAERERIEKQHEALARYEAERTAQEAAESVKNLAGEDSAEAKAKKGTERQETAEIDKIAQPIQLDFRVWVSREQMSALRQFLISNNIRFGKVPTKNK